MKKIILASFSFLFLASLSLVSASGAYAADACYKACKVEHKLCKKSKVAECNYDLECILSEFEDCRDVQTICLDKCAKNLDLTPADSAQAIH